MEAVTQKQSRPGRAGVRLRATLRRLPVYKSLYRAVGVTLNLRSHLALSRLPGCKNMRYRYLRSYYLGGGFSIPQRLKVAIEHHEYLARHVQPGFMESCARSGKLLWSQALADLETGLDAGLDARIVLRLPYQYNYDGDLCLSLDVNGENIYLMTFSIAPGAVVGAAQPQVLLVSGIQGIAGSIDQIRRVTELCNNVAPAHMLLMAAETLAAALGIKAIVGIGGSHMPAAQAGDQGRSKFDYDAFWSAMVGAEQAADFYPMPLPFADKPIESIAAKHRSRARKRRELRNLLRHDIEQQSQLSLTRDCLR